MNPLETVAAALGLANQWLTVRQSILCWPAGIASVLIYAVVFEEARLYSDLLLQGCYVALQAYGWWNWSRLRAFSRVPAAPRRLLHVSRLSASGWLAAIGAAALLALGLGGVMARYTNAAFPFVDATATALSLVAQALQAMKVLESWLVFLVANAIFIAIYWVKGLYATIVLFAVLSAMAVAGLVRWREAYHRGRRSDPAEHR